MFFLIQRNFNNIVTIYVGGVTVLPKLWLVRPLAENCHSFAPVVCSVEKHLETCKSNCKQVKRQQSSCRVWKQWNLSDATLTGEEF